MFKLSKLVDYSIVLLTEMSGSGEIKVSSSILAEKTGIPEPTVSKVLKLLSKSDILSSVRGAGGGYALNKSINEISVVDVINSIDGPVALTACVDGSNDCCKINDNCPIKGNWNPVNTAVIEALSKVSVHTVSNK
jgi:FeS assembly SUF system regulator